jgi:hypothetical protein
LASTSGRRGLQDVSEADPPQQLGAHPVGDTIDNFGAVLRRVDVDPQGTLAEGHVDHPDDGHRNGLVLMTLAVPSYFERAPATAMFPTPRVGRLMCVTQADVQT